MSAQPSPDVPAVDFSAQIALYERILPDYLPEHEGKYLAIVGEEVFGPFESAGDAWRAALPFQLDGNIFIRMLRKGPILMPLYRAISFD